MIIIFESVILTLIILIGFIHPFLRFLPLVIFLPLLIFAQPKGWTSKKRTANNLNAKSMRAVVYDPDLTMGFKLSENHSVPKYSASQVIIKVFAAAINPVDYKVIAPKIPFIRIFWPATVGRDFSGIIVEIGSKVSGFKVGDHVFGKAVGGVLQEFTVANTDEIAIKPDHWQQAAGISLVGMTSLLALRKAELKKGDNVLIIGISGACGMIGLMLAKHIGAKVTGICSSRNKSRIESLGADEVIEYDVPSTLKRLEGVKFDVIYDTVTSPDDPDQKIIYKPFLKSDGRFVSINTQRPYEFIKAMLDIPLGVRDYLISVYWTTKYLEELASKITAKQGKQMIDREFSFTINDVIEAFKIQKSRRAKGKLVFSICS